MTTVAVTPELRELQILVQEKDELLKILTERLEVAAEQLDRLRRQGGPLEPVAHASSPSPFDDQDVADDFRQMLADWRDLQSRNWFGSLEQRLEGIQGHISHLQSGPVHSRSEEPPRQQSVAEILSKYSSENHSYDDRSSGDSDSTPSGAGETDLAPSGLELPEPPAHVDIDHASTEELREALREREVYIARLSDYLLAFDAADQIHTEGPDVGVLTPEQRAVVEEWEAKVRKELRQTQIQLWIERAQLSREQMQIQQLQHQLDAEVRRQGMSRQKTGSGPTDPSSGADSQKNKNWLGLFGNK